MKNSRRQNMFSPVLPLLGAACPLYMDWYRSERSTMNLILPETKPTGTWYSQDDHEMNRADVNSLVRHTVYLFYSRLDKVSWKTFYNFMCRFSIWTNRQHIWHNYSLFAKKRIGTFVAQQKFLNIFGSNLHEEYRFDDMANMQHHHFFKHLDVPKQEHFGNEKYSLEADTQFCDAVRYMLFQIFVRDEVEKAYGSNILLVQNMLDSEGMLNDAGIEFMENIKNKMPERWEFYHKCDPRFFRSVVEGILEVYRDMNDIVDEWNPLNLQSVVDSRLAEYEGEKRARSDEPVQCNSNELPLRLSKRLRKTIRNAF